LIPTPDLGFEYLLGIIGILIIVTTTTITFWKLSERDIGTVLVFSGLGCGFLLFFIGLNGAVGSLDWTDGKIDVWRDNVTQEILDTKCENLKELSQSYKNSNIDPYDIGKIEDEIRSEFIYKCVDTREQWWAEN
jgi:hypothetical protein